MAIEARITSFSSYTQIALDQADPEGPRTLRHGGAWIEVVPKEAQWLRYQFGADVELRDTDEPQDETPAAAVPALPTTAEAIIQSAEALRASHRDLAANATVPMGEHLPDLDKAVD